MIGSIIALTILWCLIRCIWCGAACCCGCCGGGGRRKKGHQQIPHQSPYANTPYKSPQGAAYGAPQFAQFDASSGNKRKTFNEDALPAMPSWSTATSKKVVEEVPASPQPAAENVELNRLDQNGNAAAQSPHAPMLANAEHTPLRSTSDGSYNHQQHQQQQQHPQQQYGRTENVHGPGTDYFYTGQESGVANTPYDDNRFNGYSTPTYAQSVASDRYAPSGSTAYGPPGRNPYGSPYEQPRSPVHHQFGGGYDQSPHPQAPRRPVQGSWREV